MKTLACFFSAMLIIQGTALGQTYRNADFDGLAAAFALLAKSSPPDAAHLRSLFDKCFYAPGGAGAPAPIYIEYRDTKLRYLIKYYLLCQSLKDPNFDPHDPNNWPTEDNRVGDDINAVARNNLWDARASFQFQLISLQRQCLRYVRFYIEAHYREDKDAARRILSEQMGNDPAISIMLSEAPMPKEEEGRFRPLQSQEAK